MPGCGTATHPFASHGETLSRRHRQPLSSLAPLSTGDYAMVREARGNTTSVDVKVEVVDEPHSGEVVPRPTMNDFNDAISFRSRKANAKAIDGAVDAADIFIKRPSSPTPPSDLAPVTVGTLPTPPLALLLESEEHEGALVLDVVVGRFIDEHREQVTMPSIADFTSVGVYHALMVTGTDILKQMLTDLSQTSPGGIDEDGGADTTSSSQSLLLSKIYTLQSLLVYLEHLLRECAGSLGVSAYSASAPPRDPFKGFRSVLRAVDRLSGGGCDGNDVADTPSLLHAPTGSLPDIELCLLKDDGLGWGGPTPSVEAETNLPILLPPTEMLRSLCKKWWYAQFPGLTPHEDDEQAAAAANSRDTTNPAAATHPVASSPYMVSMLSNPEDPSTQLWARLVMILHPPSAPSTPPPDAQSGSTARFCSFNTQEVSTRRLGLVLRMQPNFDNYYFATPAANSSTHRTSATDAAPPPLNGDSFIVAVGSCIADVCCCILGFINLEAGRVSRLPVESRDKAKRAGVLLLACKTVIQTSDLLSDTATRLLLHNDNNNSTTTEVDDVPPPTTSPPRVAVARATGSFSDVFVTLARCGKYTSKLRFAIGTMTMLVFVVWLLLGHLEQYLPLSAEADINYARMVWMQATNSSASASFKGEAGYYETMGEWAVRADSSYLYVEQPESYSSKRAEQKRIPPLPSVCREVESLIHSSLPHHPSIIPILPTLIAACEVGLLRALAKKAYDGAPSVSRWLRTMNDSLPPRNLAMDNSLQSCPTTNNSIIGNCHVSLYSLLRDSAWPQSNYASHSKELRRARLGVTIDSLARKYELDRHRQVELLGASNGRAFLEHELSQPANSSIRFHLVFRARRQQIRQHCANPYKVHDSPSIVLESPIYQFCMILAGYITDEERTSSKTIFSSSNAITTRAEYNHIILHANSLLSATFYYQYSQKLLFTALDQVVEFVERDMLWRTIYNCRLGSCSSSSLIQDYHVYVTDRVLIPLVAALGGAIFFLDQVLLLLIAVTNMCIAVVSSLMLYRNRRTVVKGRLRVWSVVKDAYVTAAHNIILTYGVKAAGKTPALTAKMFDVSAFTLTVLEISRGLSHYPLQSTTFDQLIAVEYITQEANQSLQHGVMKAVIAVLGEVDSVLKYHFGDAQMAPPSRVLPLALGISEADAMSLLRDRAHSLLHSGLLASIIHCLVIGNNGHCGDVGTQRRAPLAARDQVLLLKSVALTRKERAFIAIQSTHSHIQTLFDMLDDFTTTRVHGHVCHVSQLLSMDDRVRVGGGPGTPSARLMPSASQVNHFVWGWLMDAFVTSTTIIHYSASSSSAFSSDRRSVEEITVNFPCYNNATPRGDLTSGGVHRHLGTARLMSEFSTRDPLEWRAPNSLSSAVDFINPSFAVENPPFNDAASGRGGGRTDLSDRNALTIHVAALALIHDAFVAIGALTGEKWMLNHPDHVGNNEREGDLVDLDPHHHEQRKTLAAFLRHIRSLSCCIRPFPTAASASWGEDEMVQGPERDALRMYYPFLASSSSSQTNTVPLLHRVLGLEYPTQEEVRTELNCARAHKSVVMARGGILYYLHCLAFLRSSLVPHVHVNTPTKNKSRAGVCGNDRDGVQSPTPNRNGITPLQSPKPLRPDGEGCCGWFVRVGCVAEDGTHIANSFPHPSWCLRSLHRGDSLLKTTSKTNNHLRSLTTSGGVMDVIEDCIRVLREDYLRDVCGSFLYRFRKALLLGQSEGSEKDIANPAVAAINCGVATQLGIPEGVASLPTITSASPSSTTPSTLPPSDTEDSNNVGGSAPSSPTPSIPDGAADNDVTTTSTSPLFPRSPSSNLEVAKN